VAKRSLPVTSLGRAPTLAVGAVVWLSSELMFFSGLFAAYFTLKAAAASWPPPGVHLDTSLQAVFTVVLVLSSVTMQLAIRAIRTGDRNTMRRLIAATMVLAVLFLANQTREFLTLDFGIGSHSYGSAFYLLVGFHALHVAAGVVLMALILGRSAHPSFGTEDAPAVEVISYYWHFVDVVWIAVFSTIFVLR
jgi:cytochrome c oxidase subunit III